MYHIMAEAHITLGIDHVAALQACLPQSIASKQVQGVNVRKLTHMHILVYPHVSTALTYGRVLRTDTCFTLQAPARKPSCASCSLNIAAREGGPLPRGENWVGEGGLGGKLLGLPASAVATATAEAEPSSLFEGQQPVRQADSQAACYYSCSGRQAGCSLLQEGV